MWDKVSATVDKIFVQPLKKNLSGWIVAIGVMVLFMGQVQNGTLYGWTIDRDILQNTGTAILGAGIFAVILKSAQFTSLFQEHIFQVFYRPEEHATEEELKAKWQALTNAILRKTLPQSHANVTQNIMDQFFQSEVQFHYRDLEITYDMALQEDNDTIVVNHCISAELVVPSHHVNPVVEQEIVVEGDCGLTHLSVGNVAQQNIDQYLHEHLENPHKRIFRLPLADFELVEDADGDKCIKLQRETMFHDSISSGPFFANSITRYVKGLTVLAKTDRGNLILKENGHKSGGVVEPDEGGKGFKRWVLAGSNDLLLPGSGYTLVLVV